MRFLLSFLLASLFYGSVVQAQSSFKYDEPWHRDVVRGAESLVLASIKKVDNKSLETTLKIEKNPSWKIGRRKSNA